jgi:hypothetical protein
MSSFSGLRKEAWRTRTDNPAADDPQYSTSATSIQVSICASALIRRLEQAGEKAIHDKYNGEDESVYQWGWAELRRIKQLGEPNGGRRA